ncbi:DUF3352 domain-containing protein [Arsenicicoccus dermatophilus]|uniref:DUF3352 domain-containing protein n=1 Tax=Arsenicicoccus dermatophilus TaxID=1076331 RepID=UPI0039173C42
MLGGAAVLALLGGGGAYAAYHQGLFGGVGPGPAEVVPGRAVGYVRVDLNPDLGQKVAAFRLMSTLPEVRDALGEDKDPRKAILEMVRGTDPALKGVDFDRDVKPWLGERAASAAYLPADGAGVVPMLVLAVTDEAKARAGLPKLGLDQTTTDLRFSHGYAVVAPKGKGDAVLTAAAAGSLADNPRFRSDMADLGSDGLMSFWGDLTTLAKADLRPLLAAADRAMQSPGAAGGARPSPATTPADVAGLQAQLDRAGRLAAAVRLDPGHVELAGIQRGARRTANEVVGDKVDIGAVPAGTMLSLGVAGAGPALRENWPSVLKELDRQHATDRRSPSSTELVAQVRQSLGLALPDDLTTLLGKQLVLSVADQDLGAVDDQHPLLAGLRVTTDAARAQQVVRAVQARLGRQTGAGQDALPLSVEADGPTLTVALDEAYRAALAQGGTLGAEEDFRKAVPSTSSTAGLYLSLDRLEPSYLDQVPADRRELVRALRSIGLVSDQTGTSDGSFGLRLVVN